MGKENSSVNPGISLGLGDDQKNERSVCRGHIEMYDSNCKLFRIIDILLRCVSEKEVGYCLRIVLRPQ